MGQQNGAIYQEVTFGRRATGNTIGAIAAAWVSTSDDVDHDLGELGRRWVAVVLQEDVGGLPLPRIATPRTAPARLSTRPR